MSALSYLDAALGADFGEALKGSSDLRDELNGCLSNWAAVERLLALGVAGAVLGQLTGVGDIGVARVSLHQPRRLGSLLGVDLIYFNERRGALVMVQYKMLEQGREGRGGWQVRLDWQFQNELDRMRQFDCDLDNAGPYRLHPGAFFVKMMKRRSAPSAAGIVISLGHLDYMLANDGLVGKRDGLRIDHGELDGHYLGSNAFVELMRSGYIGTRGATTMHLQAMINATLDDGRCRRGDPPRLWTIAKRARLTPWDVRTRFIKFIRH